MNKVRIYESIMRDVSKIVKNSLNEYDEYDDEYDAYDDEYEDDAPYLSDQDIHKQFEDFEIDELSIKPRRFYDGGFGWDIGFMIYFPNVDHPDFDDSKWENVTVWDEEGRGRISWDGWYPEDISQQLENMIRSEIKNHKLEMEAFKDECEQENKIRTDEDKIIRRRRSDYISESTKNRKMLRHTIIGIHGR